MIVNVLTISNNIIYKTIFIQLSFVGLANLTSLLLLSILEVCVVLFAEDLN